MAKGWGRTARCLGGLTALVALAATPATAQAPAYQTVRVAVHVHTDYSTGATTLAETVARARERGLDAIVITDDDRLEVGYGLPPWRRLLRLTRAEPALLQPDHLADYLAEIQRLDAAYEDVIVIDGVESAPYYHWDVDWRGRSWTVRSWNKHLTAIGLGSEAAYRTLPVLGGDGMWQVEAPWVRALRCLWPLAGLLYALWLGRGLHPRGVRLVVGLVCLLFLADGAVAGFRSVRFSPYADAGAPPYQTFIDAVAQRGGLSFWGHPEGASTIPPMSVAGGLVTVRSVTGVHADDLVTTTGYTGFAALYADNITATEPGHEWDRVLVDYLRGGRDEPAWGTGEVDYHGAADEDIDDIETVLLVEDRSRQGVLAALSRGRGYAVRGGDEALRLDRWQVETRATQAVAGQEVGTGGEPWRVRVRLDKVSGTAEAVRVRLVRADEGGHVEVVADITGETPIELEHRETRLAPGRRCYYRLLAHSRTSILTSNPIFVLGGRGGS